ncbi:MAG: CDP-glucose 4,6-dehydratase [Gemmatimonadota bacterium]
MESQPRASLESFYRGKRVLLTGHTGFKGSWMAAWLKLMGARVTGYALAPDAGPAGLFTAGKVGQGMASIIGDIRDRSALAAVVREQQPEIVFHLAAQPLVRQSYVDPVETYEVNVIGTANLLDELRKTECVRSIVVITSDKCYENREWDWPYRETDQLGGHDPYSSSKACTELVTAAFRSSFFHAGGRHVGIATARAGNVIGGGDWSTDRIVPDIIRALAERRAVVLRNPGAVRPWQHVLEPLRGYLMLAERVWFDPTISGGWNFGPRGDDAVPVHELTQRILAAWGEGNLEICPPPNAPHEARLLRLDFSKATSRLGWGPLLRLDEAIQTTVTWYRTAVQQPAAVPELTVKQIRAFRDLSLLAGAAHVRIPTHGAILPVAANMGARPPKETESR